MTRDTESRQQQPQPQPAPQPPAEPQQDDNANPFRHFLRDIDIAAAVARRNLPQQQAAELDYEINEDGIIEGGVAVPVPASVAHYLSDDHVGGGSGGGLRRSTECDLVRVVPVFKILARQNYFIKLILSLMKQRYYSLNARKTYSYVLIPLRNAVQQYQ